MKTDDESSDRQTDTAEIAIFLVRSSFAFVLGLIFLFIPQTTLESGKPWHFWVRSAIAAFAFGAVLFYIGFRRLRWL